MAKRTATSDLNHENWDREDEPEDAGTFKKAADDVLKTRVIKTARRRNPVAMSNDDGEKKNIFASFSGFAKSSSTTASTPTVAASNPLFVFLSNTATKTDAPKTNGMELSQSEKNTKQNDVKDDTYYGKLKGLNISVSKWIKNHVDENPFVNLLPVFDDYRKYYDEIEKDKSTNLQNSNAKIEVEKNCSSNSTDKVPESSSEKVSFKFGASLNKDNVSTNTSTTEQTKPTFTFGRINTSSASTVSATQFSFGNTTNSSGFSFSSTGSSSSIAPFTFAGVTKSADLQSEENKVTEEEDEDSPPKVEFTPVVEEGHIYTVRCKVFVKKDGNFSDRGVGNMYLKPIENSEKVQLIVRADTNLGNLLCNFILSENIPTKRMGKKDVMLVCLPTPDTKPPPVPILLRVKSPEEADALLETLEKHKK